MSESFVIQRGRRSDTILLEEYDLADLHERFGEHKRLKVFRIKGTSCVTCDATGVRLVRTQSVHRETGHHHDHEHVDVYTEDWVLMTVDHIIPRSKGGNNSMRNKQPMCIRCNGTKADKLITNEEVILLRRSDVK